MLCVRNSKDVTIDQCELNGCGAIGVEATGSSLAITNSHIHSNSVSAFTFDTCTADVTGNIIENNAAVGLQGVESEVRSSDNVIRNNGDTEVNPRAPSQKLNPSGGE